MQIESDKFQSQPIRMVFSVCRCVRDRVIGSLHLLRVHALVFNSVTSQSEKNSKSRRRQIKIKNSLLHVNYYSSENPFLGFLCYDFIKLAMSLRGKYCLICGILHKLHCSFYLVFSCRQKDS